ncbi:DegV family protein [Bacillus sp. AGMB 02131]|uniref:DegV family protein n=1 Tax=Peribacillus faecalis TaxID=2772559 RepID=A0A927CYY7_9BACI|nr:DegV family protein [Peribacillus faecalis]MBD3108505.1 DegV family protein [Peribacillus faecalis]
MRTAIVTDSTAYIPKEIRDQLNIHMVPLSVVFGTETYREEIDITAEEFFKKIKETGQLPTTSMPPIGLFVEKFEELAKDYDAVICIHLSSGISGTFQGSITSGEMVDDIKVYSFDSELACSVEGFYVIEAAKMALEGADPEAIIARLDEIKKSVRAYFMVDDLTNLQRGGRLSSAQAIIGSLLQVKPVLHFQDKKIVPFEKIRTRKKAINRIVELFEEDASSGVPMECVIIEANGEAQALELKQQLEAKYPNVNFNTSYFGPVIGTHLGEGAVGIGWYKK